MTTRDLRLDPRHGEPAVRNPTLADLRDMPAFAGCEVHPPGADLSPVLRGVRPGGGDVAADGDLLVVDGAPPPVPAAGAVGAVAREAPPPGYPVPV
ncbi:MAG TPA: hypothetical protein VM434_00030, partial [Beijerinckiaceae bacterium]|nr:hypothetical protein [Beijerinckiaceae bacterium]